MEGKFHCEVEATISIIGGKYKAIIIYHLRNKVLRYGELKRMVPQVSQKMLTQQLKQLEADGVVKRDVYPVVPPKVEYSLTEFGKTLIPLVQNMHKWGEEHMKESIVRREE